MYGVQVTGLSCLLKTGQAAPVICLCDFLCALCFLCALIGHFFFSAGQHWLFGCSTLHGQDGVELACLQ